MPISLIINEMNIQNTMPNGQGYLWFLLLVICTKYKAKHLKTSVFRGIETNIILMPNWGKGRKKRNKTKRRMGKERNRMNWGAHWLTGMNSKKKMKKKRKTENSGWDESIKQKGS